MVWVGELGRNTYIHTYIHHACIIHIVDAHYIYRVHNWREQILIQLCAGVPVFRCVRLSVSVSVCLSVFMHACVHVQR